MLLATRIGIPFLKNQKLGHNNIWWLGAGVKETLLTNHTMENTEMY
jgi:hypothetical protein